MLIKLQHLKLIRQGDISLAFRKWNTPRGKQGSLIHTAVGRLEILAVDQVNIDNITEKDAVSAGYATRRELIDILQKRKNGDVFRIELRYHSPDPRLSLREEDKLSQEEILQIRSKLSAMDNRSKQGPWTHSVLSAIDKHSATRAADLAREIGFEKDWLKINVRKLKNLGLTISLEVGYRLSPRGKAILEHMNESSDN